MNDRSPLDARAGLTLVELVLAIALSAMLMAAMVGILKGVHTQSRQIDRMRGEVWQSRLADLLYQDLLSAETMHQSDGLMHLNGEFRSLSPHGSGTSTQVAYGIIDKGQGEAGATESLSLTTLVRRCNGIDGLIAIGASEIKVERVDRDGSPQPLPPSPGPMPSRIRIWVWSDADQQPVFSRDLDLR